MSKLKEALAKRGVSLAPPRVPPRTVIPDYNPFPVDSLPDVPREYAIEVAESIGCDVSFAALPALALAGAAIGNALHISPNKRGHTEPPLLWTCTIGDPGTGKTPALKPVERIALRIQAKHDAAHNKAVTDYDAKLHAWKEAGKDPEAKPPKPVAKLFHISDITIEQLVTDCSENPRGLMLVRDEMAGWFGSHTKYSKNGVSDSPAWLSIYNGGAISNRRKTGEPRFVKAERSFVGICGGIQPDALQRQFADGKFFGNGMVPRIVFAWPPKCCPDSEAELSEATEQDFADIIDRLQVLPFIDKPFVVKLMPDAYAAYRSFSKEFSTIAEGIEGGSAAAIYPKAKMLALRLALIDHAVSEAVCQRDAGKSSVSLDSMRRAIILARWLTAEALRVYAMLAEAPADTDQRQLVELVKRHGGSITTRKLQRSNNRKYPEAVYAELALDVLVDAGYGQWKEECPERGGKKTKRFVLNKQQPIPDDDAE